MSLSRSRLRAGGKLKPTGNLPFMSAGSSNCPATVERLSYGGMPLSVPLSSVAWYISR